MLAQYTFNYAELIMFPDNSLSVRPSSYILSFDAFGYPMSTLASRKRDSVTWFEPTALFQVFFQFSAHISYGKGKYFNQTGFFYKICQASNLYLTLRVLTIEFNSHKFSFVQFVFLNISDFFIWPQEPQNDPKLTQKWPRKENICKNFVK